MKKVIMALTALAVAGLVAYRLNARIQLNESVKARSEEVSMPAVTVGTPTRQVIAAKVQITGNIRPANEVEIFSKTSGRLDAVLVPLGAKIRKGQALATVERQVYALQAKQAQAALDAARAQLMTAEKSAESAEKLAKSNNIADIALVQARSASLAARAQVAQAEAQLGLAQENLRNTAITSPIDGVITRRNADVGQMVSPGGGGPQSALFQVQDLRTLKLEATIDEKEVPLVSEGQTVQFQVDAYLGQTFTGTIRHLSPSLDRVSRRASIEVSIDNPDGKLYANMFARGEIQHSTPQEVLTLPQTALVKGATPPAVYVAKGDTVHLQTVTLGETDGVSVTIREGLTDSDQVVLSGNSRLSDGAKVIIQPIKAQK